jgi:hypothetical protein
MGAWVGLKTARVPGAALPTRVGTIFYLQLPINLQLPIKHGCYTSCRRAARVEAAKELLQAADKFVKKQKNSFYL